ncbi:FadR/GntR family transcriptional regulator [Cryobacterium sp. AP23]
MAALGDETWRDRGLHSQVVNTLGQEIVDGTYAAGDILNLDRLSERFTVSRSVLREAMRVLQSAGMVEPRQRVGTQVLPRRSWDLVNPQVIQWRGRGDYFAQMREMLQVRLGIEPVAARLSARLMTDDQRAAVARCAAVMVQADRAHDGRRYLDADVEFHTLILQGSGNAVIGHFAKTVEALLRTREQEKRLTITDYTPASAHRHNDLAEAIVSGDEDAAYRWAYETIEATLNEFLQEAQPAREP